MKTVIPKNMYSDIKKFMDDYDEDYPDINNIMNISSDDYELFIQIRLETKLESIIIYLSGNNFESESTKIFDVEVLPYGYLIDTIKNINDSVDKIDEDLLNKIMSAIEHYITDTEKILNTKIPFKNPHKNILSTKDEIIIDIQEQDVSESESDLFEKDKKVFNVSVLPEELPSSITRLLKVYDKIQVEFSIYNDYLNLDLFVNLFLENNTNLCGIDYIHSYIIRGMNGEENKIIHQSIKKNYIVDFDFANVDITDFLSDESSKKQLTNMVTKSIEDCISYLKKVGNGKIKYKIYVYRRTN